jgi:chemotaxis protein methyltransferase CheR
VIVCRNVLIYFTPEAADRTLGWLAERLAPHGTLVLSTAEPVLKPRADLETRRVGGTFFYVPRAQRSAPVTQEAPRAAAPTPRPSAPPLAAPRPSAPSPVPTPRPSAPSSSPSPHPSAPTSSGSSAGPPLTPAQEGELLFSLVLDWAAAGQDDDETAQGLRKALYLAPELAAARYCLGLLLEQRGLRTDALTEYRRALAVLQSGRAMPTPFFLNAERLTAACRAALERLGG